MQYDSDVDPRDRIRRLIEADLPDDAVETEALRLVEPDQVEQFIVEAITATRPDNGWAARRRWWRRACDKGQLWALWEVGQREDSWPEETYYGSSDVQDQIQPEEARVWLEQAADRGHPGAALLAARTAADDEPRKVGWLTTAYEAGESDQGGLQLSERLAAAALLGREFRERDPDLAQEWYWRALAHGEWFEPYGEGATSSVRVAVEFALWLCSRGETDACAGWCEALAAEAAQNTWGDRIVLEEEGHKSWRYDYVMASRDDHARFRILQHRLDEHRLPAPNRWETLARLADTETFERRSREPELRDWLVRALELAECDTTPIAGPESLMLAEIRAEHAWEFSVWILGAAIPLVIERAGFAAEVEELRRTPPSVEALQADSYAAYDWWIEQAEGTDPDQRNEVTDPITHVECSYAWQRLVYAAHEHYTRSSASRDEQAHQERTKDRIEVLSATGLAGHLDDQGHVLAASGNLLYRLLRGDPLWFAFWSQTGPGGWRSWESISEQIGCLLVKSLFEVLELCGKQTTLEIAAELRSEFYGFLRRLSP